MPTIATLEVEVNAKSSNITAFLSQLQSQLQAADAAAQKAAASIGNAFSGAAGSAGTSLKALGQSAQQAAADQLRLAQSEARGLITKGELTAASQRLTTAIVSYRASMDGTVASVIKLQNAENQLVSVQERISKQASQGFQPLTNAFEGLSKLSLGAGLISEIVGTTGEFINLGSEAEKIDATFKALSGTEAKYQANLKIAHEQQALFGGSLKDTEEAMSGFLNLSNRTSVSVEKLVNTARALATVDPEQGFKGASVALKEFFSGDATSLARRFELSKKALNEIKNLKPEEAFVKLNQVLAENGITQALVQAQTQTTAVAYDKLKGSVADVTTTLSQLTGQALAPLAAGSAKVFQEINANIQPLSNAGNQMQQFGAKLLSSSTSFEQFNTRAQAFNNQIGLLSLIIGKFPQLTAQQFAFAKGLQATGASAEQINTALQNTTGVAQNLSNAYQQSGNFAAQGAAKQQQFGQAVLQVAQYGQEGIAVAQGQIGAIEAGNRTTEQGISTLTAFIAAKQQHVQATTEETSATQAATLAFQGDTDAILQELTQKQSNEVATLQLSQAQSTLAGLGSQVASGLITAGNAAAILASQYNIASSAAIQLINLQAQLARAEAVKAAGFSGVPEAFLGAAVGGGRSVTQQKDFVTGLKNQQVALDNLNKARSDQVLSTGTAAQKQAELNKLVADSIRLHGKDSAETVNAQTKLLQFEQQQDKSAKKRAGGGALPGISNARLTDQQKLQNSLLTDQEAFANKSEQEETKHQQKLTDIDQQYAEKRNEVDKKFHLDRLQSEADFYEGLSSIKDRGVQKQIDAQYQQALLKAEEIARSKGGDAANAFLDAQTSIIQKRGSLLDKIAGLTDKKGKDKQTQQADANQAEYLRGVLALQERASALKLSQVEGEGSAIANERQRQLDDENARFQSATDQLTNKAADSAEKRVNASIRAAKQVDQEALAVENLGTAYTNVADAILTGARAATAAAPTGVVFPKRGASSTAGAPQVNVTGPTGNVPTTPDNTPVPVEITKQQTSGNPVVDAVNAVRATLESVGRDIVSAENATARSVRSISVSPLVTR